MTQILWKYVYLHDLGPFQKNRNRTSQNQFFPALGATDWTQKGPYLIFWDNFGPPLVFKGGPRRQKSAQI